MNNVMGFFILGHVWNYLHSRTPFEIAPLFLVSDLQLALVHDRATDQDALRFLLDCQDWRKVMGVAELISKEAA